jgi:hypothetical protein
MRARTVRYDAFISYSRRDEAAAARLHTAVERLGRPIWRRRAMRVFRDKTGLPVGPAWRQQLHGAIDESRSFVLVVSLSSATSEPVREELRHWIETRGTDNLYLVHLDGTLLWSPELGDWSADSDVPAELRGLFDQEPGYLDLSPDLSPTVAGATDRGKRAAADERLRTHAVLLAAPIRRKRTDRLLWMERHRRSRMAVGIVSLVTCAGLVFTLVYALRLRDAKITVDCDKAVKPVAASFDEYDGTLLTTTSETGQHWGFLLDRAFWEFADQAEVRQFGYDPATAVRKDASEWRAMQQDRHRPPDGSLFREIRAGDEKPGRLYLIKAGMPFEVSNPKDLADIGLKARDADLVPANPYPSTQPIAKPYARAGALVQIAGTDTVWKVDAKNHWIRARRRCDGAYVPRIPHSRDVMKNLDFRSDLRQDPADARDVRSASENVSPEIWIDCTPGNFMRRGNGLLKNLSNHKVTYRVNMRTVNAQGTETGSHNPAVRTLGPGEVKRWKVEFGPRQTKGDGGHCRVRIDVVRVFQ